MKYAPLVALALTACGHPEMHFDVVVTQDLVIVSGYELAHPHAVRWPLFAPPGTCSAYSDDDPGCTDGCAGEWIDRVEVENDGAPLGEAPFYATRGAATITLDTTGFSSAHVVIVDGDETTAIAIPDVARPVATIDNVVSVPDQNTTQVTWHSTPSAASAEIEVSGGLAGRFCHVMGDGGTDTIDLYGGVVGINAFAPVQHVETGFGDADVWVGTRVYR